MPVEMSSSVTRTDPSNRDPMPMEMTSSSSVATKDSNGDLMPMEMRRHRWQEETPMIKILCPWR